MKPNLASCLFYLVFAAALSLAPARAGGPLLSTNGLTPNQASVVQTINQTAAFYDFYPYFEGYINGAPVVDELSEIIGYELPPSERAAFIDSLTPEKFGHFASLTAFNNATFETEAMDNYLAGRLDANGEFLGGSGTLDVSGLTLNSGSSDPTLGMIHSRLMAWNPSSDGAISDTAGALLGGVDMKDTKTMAGPTYDNPWNFFVRGNVVLSQGFSQAETAHFNDTTSSVVLGTDYRIDPNFLVGITGSYAHSDADLDEIGSRATVDSYSPGIYASYADKGWYANLVGNYVHNAYTEKRVIEFVNTLNGAPEGDQGTADIDGGYDFHSGALTYGPLAGLQYTHLTVDGYSEDGGFAALQVGQEQADSLRSRLGGRVSYAFSEWGMKMTPHLDASWQHEFLDSGAGISGNFIGSVNGDFNIRTASPQRDSALVDAGLDVDVAKLVTAFADYSAQAGQDNYFGQSIQAGLRIGF